MEKYGLVKHLKTGWFLKLEYIDSIGYISAVDNRYKATIFTENESNNFYFDDYFVNLLKNVSFDNLTYDNDISKDEFKFIECELKLID